MKDPIVSLERNGVMEPVGRICGENTADSQFSYSDDNLKKADAVAVSLSLPLQAKAFSATQTKEDKRSAGVQLEMRRSRLRF